MKALVLERPQQASVRNICEPGLSENEILLKVRMVGLCGTDLSSFRGTNPLVSFPRILGHEVCASVVGGEGIGTVLTAGADLALCPYKSCGTCTSCLGGRPNACQYNQTLGVQRDGALTEFIVMPREKLYPAKLSVTELSLVEPLAVAFHAVTRGGITANDTVAVFGCGGVGLGIVAAALFRGARTICVDVSDEKLELARLAGAKHTINSRHEPLHDRLWQITDGHGPDVAIEAVGSPATFRAAVEEVSFSGRVVYLGYTKEPVSYETRLFVQKELDIKGSRNAQPEDFRDAIRLLELHRFPTDLAVSLIVPLEEAANALRLWSENPSQFHKILVSLD